MTNSIDKERIIYGFSMDMSSDNAIEKFISSREGRMINALVKKSGLKCIVHANDLKASDRQVNMHIGFIDKDTDVSVPNSDVYLPYPLRSIDEFDPCDELTDGFVSDVKDYLRILRKSRLVTYRGHMLSDKKFAHITDEELMIAADIESDE